MALHVVGVRHHSPACARLVEHTITRVRPAIVLIEGPVDFNDRLDELRLPHRLPIALFSYEHSHAHSSASWAPFCDYSPEWIALRTGDAVGAQVRFMDLPAWSRAFSGQRNRYADGARRSATYVQVLCQRLGLDGMDALWDHLFEQPLATDELAARLSAYFEALRGDDPAEARDVAREAFMAQCLAWAVASAGQADVVAVCGGYHKPALEKAWATQPSVWPVVPQEEAPTGEPVRRGSYLVSYSFHRLDSFTGYESGMPSPAFYQTLWEDGADAAPAKMLRAAVERLRARHQHVSAADLIGASTMAEGLARLRGHTSLARSDVLDGLASALLKEAQDHPLPWTERGTLAPGTDPAIVELIAAFSGQRQGKLAPGTPRPPLIADVADELARTALEPGAKPRDVALDPTQPADLERSRVLHRLRVLDIPGFERRSGPSSGSSGSSGSSASGSSASGSSLTERWTVAQRPGTESALIEAAAWGPTLASAAASRLEAGMGAAAGDLERLSQLLVEAVFIGIDGLSARLLDTLATEVGHEVRLERLGSALGNLLALWRHDTVFGAAGAPALGTVLAAGFERGLWLLEDLHGPAAPLDAPIVAAVVHLRDVLRVAGAPLTLDATRAHEVMTRRLADPNAPPAVRGAALGVLWSLGQLGDDARSSEHAAAALRQVALPATLGDFLAGLFALAREQVTSAVGLARLLDDIVTAMNGDEFLRALPALRLAFGYYPPREKDRLARLVLQLHGQDPDGARQLRRLVATPELVTAGLALDARITQLETRHGLAPEIIDGD